MLEDLVIYEFRVMEPWVLENKSSCQGRTGNKKTLSELKECKSGMREKDNEMLYSGHGKAIAIMNSQ